MPEEPKVTSRLRPRWQIVDRVVQERVVDEEFDGEIAPAVAEFIARAEAAGIETPKPQQVVDRIRHVLRHSRGSEELVLVSRPRPPWFGVTTRPAETVTRRNRG